MSETDSSSSSLTLGSRSARHPLISSAMSAAPDFLLAWAFLRTWIAPYRYDIHGISWGVSIMLLEFVVIHSSVFFGVVIYSSMQKSVKIPLLLALTTFYSLFAYFFGSWSTLASFLLLCVNRSMPVITGQIPSERPIKTLVTHWVAASVLYVASIGFTSSVNIPELGVTGEAITAQGFSFTGLWANEPNRALAAGVVYYIGIGLAQLCPGVLAWKRSSQTNIAASAQR